ncbi:MAG: HlyD family efflux transporter periplasmic adaptor subunit [Spirochaetia bacterium]|jgi:multidrug efflux pump subunit AcrA (membrane-fusion protein)
MNGRRIIPFTAAIVLLLAVLVGCGGGGQAASGQPGGSGQNMRPAGQQRPGVRVSAIPVQAVTIHVGPLKTTNDTAGTVVPVTLSSVASQVAGVVSAVPRQPGDWVKAGATVVQLDDSQLKLSVQNAEASLANARINYQIGQDNVDQDNPKLQLQVQSAQSALASAQKNYDSQKALYAIGGISASVLDTANSQLQQAQANLEAANTALEQNKKSGTQTLAQLKLAIDMSQNALQIAQLNLQYAVIKAPFAGQIAAINVTPGMYVSLSTAVFVLVSAEREISFNVPPADAATLPVGAILHFTYLGKDYPVRVSQAPSAPINGVVPMIADLRSAPLQYGAVGTVTYSLSLASGALIPIAALQVNEDQNYVFSIAEGKVTTRPITILAESGTTAAVAGIEEGVQVVLNPPPGLLPGAAVQAVSLNGSAPAPAAGGPPKGQSTGISGAQGPTSLSGGSATSVSGSKP